MRTLAFWLSLVLIFMIPWENMVVVSSLGTISRGAGLLMAAFWGATVVVTGRFRKPRPFHATVFLFMLWSTVSVFWSVDVDMTIIRLLTYFQLLGFVLILWDLYTTPAALKAGLQAYVLGAYVSIGSVVINYHTGVSSNPGRYTATGFNETYVALILALGIPVAWHLATSESDSKKTHLLRLVNYAYIPAATLAILLTATRGALIAAFPAFFFVFASFIRLKLFQRVLLFATLIGALVALQPLIPQKSLDRLGTTGTSIAEGDFGERGPVWREGIAIFEEHPLLGVGGGAFRVAATGTRHSAHNTYLSVLVEVGIIGFGLFAIILAMAVYHAWHQPKWDSRFWLTVLIVWAVGVVTIALENRKAIWLFLSLVVVSANVSGDSAKSKPSSAFSPQKALNVPSVASLSEAGAPNRSK
jgi:O-antigen ligase